MLKDLNPIAHPFPRGNVFVLFYAVPRGDGMFDGTEEVDFTTIVTENPEKAIAEVMEEQKCLYENVQPCGFFTWERLNGLGEALEWGEDRWMVFTVSGDELTVEQVRAGSAEAAVGDRKLRGGVAGVFSGAMVKDVMRRVEKSRRGELGCSFVFASQEDEAEWAAGYEDRKTPEYKAARAARIASAVEWARQEEEKKANEKTEGED